jgi:uncharacterized protein YkwD
VTTASKTRHARLALLAATTALVAACGGGADTTEPTAGGPSPSPTAAPTPSPAPGPTPSPSPAPAPVPAEATCNLPNFQAELLQRVNAVRAAGASCGARGSFAPVAALQWQAALTTAALRHSQDMATNDFFSHTGSSGSSAGQRLTAAGYAWRTYGENIAAGYGTVQAVMDGWMSSEGHCANVMNASFREIGVACVPGGSSRYPTYWTMDLGAR